MALAEDVRQGVDTLAQETRIIDADDAAFGRWVAECGKCSARLILPI
jgi:hypothetical protein